MTVAVCLGAFSGPFDTTVVAFSLPAVRHRFGTSMAAVQWVSLAHLLTVVALLTLAGRAAGALGGRPLLVSGFVVVTIASAGCGLASTLVLIITFRVAQGVGTAALVTAVSTVTSTSLAPERRRPVMRARGVAQTLGLVTGPAAGGVLIGLWGWRSVFLVSVPIGIAGAVAGSGLLPRTRDRTAAGRLDWMRAALTTAFAASALLLVSVVSGLALPSWAVVTSAVVCALSCAGLGVRARRRAPGPATTREARLSTVAAAGAQPALFALLESLAQLCAVRGVRPAIAGVVVAAPLTGFAAGSLARRGSVRVRTPATAAFSGIAVGLATATLCTHVLGPPDAGPNGATLTLAVLIPAVLILAVPVIAVPVITGTASVARPRAPVPRTEGHGTPPDARFLLANERTFLAWSRTALALVAAGLAIVQLLHPFPGIPWGRHLLGVLLIAVGAVIATVGYLELQRNQRALHRNEPLPPSVLPKVLTLAILSMAVVSAAVLIISATHDR